MILPQKYIKFWTDASKITKYCDLFQKYHSTNSFNDWFAYYDGNDIFSGNLFSVLENHYFFILDYAFFDTESIVQNIILLLLY